MILWDWLSADPHLILFNKSNPPRRVAFLWCLALPNKKPRQRQGFPEEYVQESVLVSTLNMYSALLTPFELKALNYDYLLCQTLWQLALCHCLALAFVRDHLQRDRPSAGDALNTAKP